MSTSPKTFETSTLSGSPDALSGSMTRIATSAAKQRKLVFVAAVILLAATLAASLYITKRTAFRGQASEGLFRARATVATEYKAIADRLNPAEPAKAPRKDGKAIPRTPPKSGPVVEFARLDVDAEFKNGVAALERVSREYPGTLAGFDAKMDLGSLYFDHAANTAAYEKAAKWFENAASGAPSSDHTAGALYNWGYAQEALGRCAEAVKTFERAVNTGPGPLTGEILRAKARCQETLGDKPGAKTTYETIVKTLPNSEAARFAEMKKAAL